MCYLVKFKYYFYIACINHSLNVYLPLISLQNKDDRQPKAVKRPSSKVCFILNPSFYLSILSRSQYLSRLIFINTPVKWHEKSIQFFCLPTFRDFYTYIGNIQEISKGSRFPWKITSILKMKLYTNER